MLFCKLLYNGDTQKLTTGDTMQITVSDASKSWGITRQTIYKKIKQGKLSQLHNKKIDVAEMVRVFGEPSVNGDTPRVTRVDNRLQGEHEARLQEKIHALEENLRQAQEREKWLQNQVERLTDAVKLLEFKKPEKEEKKGFIARVLGF